ncbi:hypothetical protein TNCV_416871 [Trichonephila clavipes]|nr:hypothetical protein TNCV_416871 [Trichonephila clavipes]
MIKSDVWTIQALRQLLNIANIKSRSWSGTEFVQVVVLVEEGAKTNQKVYRRDIIEAVVLPGHPKHFEKGNWTLQQDSVLVCQAKKAQKWGKANFPDMISPEE